MNIFPNFRYFKFSIEIRRSGKICLPNRTGPDQSKNAGSQIRSAPNWLMFDLLHCEWSAIHAPAACPPPQLQIFISIGPLRLQKVSGALQIPSWFLVLHLVIREWEEYAGIMISAEGNADNELLSVLKFTGMLLYNI